MEDKPTEKKEFIREKVKSTPINKKRALEKLGLSILCGLVFSLTSCFVYVMLYPFIGNVQDTSVTQQRDENAQQEEEETPQIEESNIETDQAALDSIDAYELMTKGMYSIGQQCNRYVVSVTSVKSGTDAFDYAYETNTSGAGVILQEQGGNLLILTDCDLIADAASLYVTFNDGKTADASIQIMDGNTGLGILAVSESKLTGETLESISTAVFGDTSGEQEGDMVIALGNPLGSNFSIALGMVTNTEDELILEDFNYKTVDTDIISNGNCSGVLANSSGEVIGIITQDVNKNTDQIKAVSYDALSPVVEKLLAGNHVPYVGIQVSNVTADIQASYNIPSGVYVRSVSLDSPAMEAGIQSGDIIVKLGDVSFSTVSGYSNALMYCEDQQTSITVKRQTASGYKEVELDVTLGSLTTP